MSHSEPRSVRDDEAGKLKMADFAMNGKKPLKQIVVKVYEVGGKRFKTYYFRAGKKQAFTKDGVEDILAKVAEELETRYREYDYSLRQWAPGGYSFVWLGRKTAEVTR